jgi:lipid II:glycine glycyltransferase (peptidoglycan interpeptide bridge formation enzyme)
MAYTENDLSLINSLAYKWPGNLRKIGNAYAYGRDSSSNSAALSAISSNLSADTASISKNAQNASNVYNKVKATGTENAAIFRQALVSMASNSNSSAFGNFLSLGTSMAESGNMKTYTDLTLMVAGLGRLNSGAGVSSKIINQTQSTAQTFGFAAAGEFVGAARAIVSKAEDSGNKGAQVSALNSFARLWEKTSNSTGFTAEETRGALSKIAGNVESKGTLSEISGYINERLEALGEKENNEEEKANANMSEALNGDTSARSYSRSSFIKNQAMAGAQSSLLSSMFGDGGMAGLNRSQSINAYRNNMNAFVAGNLITSA